MHHQGLGVDLRTDILLLMISVCMRVCTEHVLHLPRLGLLMKGQALLVSNEESML